MIRGLIAQYFGNIEMIFQELLIEYGLSMYAGAQFISGMGLLLVVPDAIVTPTFVMVYADSFLEVFGIATISAMMLVAGNFIMFLFSKFLGHRYFADDRFDSRFWKFMNWTVKKNAPTSLIVMRFLPVGNGLIAIPAGLLDVNVKTFLSYSFVGFLIMEMSLAFGMWYGLEEGILQAFIGEAEIIG
ncbi:MAG: VTT domain-containing protein [Candidatus Nanohaloarchaea archaeon]